MKAKWAQQCPVCFHWWKEGDEIARLNEPLRITGWKDFGMNKGQKWESKPKYWAHEKCAKEKNNG